MNRKTLVWLLSIVAIAGMVRIIALDRVPPGIFFDEALKGVEGIEAVHSGQFRWFYPSNLSEGLWVATIGFSEKIFGVNGFGLRFPAALAGTLTVVFLFFLARRAWGDRVALLAAWFVATGFWHLNFSRIAFSGIEVPFFLTASIFLLLLAQDRHENSKPHAWWLAVIGGVIYGLGFHSYVAYRISPLLIALLFVLETLRRRKLGIEIAFWMKSFALWLGVAILVALPMGIYFLQHPEDFSRRVLELSVFQEQHPWQIEGRVLLRTLGMFNFHGDENWRHNFGGHPELLAPVGICFLVGLYMTGARAFRAKWVAQQEWMLLAWFPIMLIPELMTQEGTPHALRAIGSTVPVYIFAGMGADLLWQKLPPKRFFAGLMVAGVIAVGGYDLWKYFHDWARHGAHIGYQSFNGRQAADSRLLNSLPVSTPRFVLFEDEPQHVTRPDLLNAPGRVDYSLPVPAQPVVFGTFDHPEPKFVYLPDEIRALESGERMPAGSVVVPLEGRQHTLDELTRHGLPIQVHTNPVLYGLVR